MDAVEREDDHHYEVRDEQGDVEGVPVVGVAEGVVGVVRLPVVAETARRGEEDYERIEMAGQEALRGRAGYREILREGGGCFIWACFYHRDWRKHHKAAFALDHKIHLNW